MVSVTNLHQWEGMPCCSWYHDTVLLHNQSSSATTITVYRQVKIIAVSIYCKLFVFNNIFAFVAAFYLLQIVSIVCTYLMEVRELAHW